MVLRGHDGTVNAVAISPSNRWVVTGSADKTARLWDLMAKDPANPVVLRGHEDNVNAVAISPDNRWVVTAGRYDKTARLWLLQMNDLIDLARITVGRNFFTNEWQLYFPGEKHADVICTPMRPSPMDFGVTTNTAELVTRLKRSESRAYVILNQLRKGTYWSKKMENLDGADFAVPVAKVSFTLRECFAHALTVGWDALDDSACLGSA